MLRRANQHPGGGRRARRRRTALAVCLVVLALVTGATPAHPSSCPSACVRVETLRTAKGSYELRLPARWNGTLLVWSHGYRLPGPPGPAAVAPDQATAAELLAAGYGLVGSSWAQGGWAVEDALVAAREARLWFAQRVGAPRRTVAWGESLGGLVTALWAERDPQLVDAAAPECATLGGPLRKVDLGVVVLAGVHALLDPRLPLALPASAVAARQVDARAADALARADPATVALLAGLVDAPTRSRSADGTTAGSRTAARRVALRQALAAATWQRRDIADRLGGDPASLHPTRLLGRLDPGERAEITELSPGVLERAAAAFLLLPELTAHPSVRLRARAGTPTGDLHVPMVTLHTRADERVPLQHERLYRDAADAHGAGRLLVQLIVDAPAAYDAPPSAGVGHCRFSPAQRRAQLDALDGWLRGGVRPAQVAMSGLVALPPPPWPARVDGGQR